MLDLPVDDWDKELFAASTVVIVGDGRTAKFWTASWVGGRSPKVIAPLLYKKSRRKNFTVQKGLEDNRWISHIIPQTSTQEFREYAALWEEVSQMQLDDNAQDSIRWRWTQDGEYTTKSAYCIQFQGTFSKLRLQPIWKAKAEPKCRYFAWTLLHKKILTANNLLRQNWPHDPVCKLCGSEPETPTHLCKDCTFLKEVWSLIKQWFGLSAIETVGTTRSIYSYWRKCRIEIAKEQRRRFDGIVIYLWWNLWKERNRRTFQNKQLNPRQVALLCKEDVDQYHWATRPDVVSQQ